MELYYMITILDRNKENEFRTLCNDLHPSVLTTNLGKGTATASVLKLHDLEPTKKAVLSGIVTAPSMKQLISMAKHKMYMDIPGNGVMLYIPIKSAGNQKNLDYFTEGQKIEGTVPDMNFDNELIVVIANEGNADMIMDAARSAGAPGGTILHAKGTNPKNTAKFFKMSVAVEKEMIYILSSSAKKSQIMQAINENCGTDTKAGAVCFSLPVSETVGIRRLDDEG